MGVIVPLVSAPIPGQLYRWYVITTLAAILLYVSSSEAFWEEFVAPIRRAPAGAYGALTKPLRIAGLHGAAPGDRVVFFHLGGGAAQPPGGLRVIHPDASRVSEFQGQAPEVERGTIHCVPMRRVWRKISSRAASCTTKTASSATAMGWRGTAIMPRGLTRRRRTSRTRERLPSCRNRSCSGVLPRVARGSQTSRRHGIRPCQCGRTFSTETEIWQVILVPVRARPAISRASWMREDTVGISGTGSRRRGHAEEARAMQQWLWRGLAVGCAGRARYRVLWARWPALRWRRLVIWRPASSCTPSAARIVTARPGMARARQRLWSIPSRAILPQGSTSFGRATRRTDGNKMAADEDIFRSISEGLHGTSMPAWSGLFTQAADRAAGAVHQDLCRGLQGRQTGRCPRFRRGDCFLAGEHCQGQRAFRKDL